MNGMKAKVINDKLTLFTEPGGIHYVDWVSKGEIVEVLEGWEYDDRDWKDKRFVKVKIPNGKEGYCIIAGLTPIKG